jgi:deoxyribodipyrimidine photo-lyase
LTHARIVVPVFVFSPEEDGDWAPGAASRWWLHHSLVCLDRDLRKRKSRLVFRRGASLATLRQLARECDASLLCFNRLYEPAACSRDDAIAQALGEEMEVVAHNANLLFEPGSIRNGEDKPYKVFTAFWRNAQAQLDPAPPIAAPRTLRPPRRWPRSELVETFALLPRVRWDEGFRERWTPGEIGAAAAMRTFAKNVPHYAEARDRPDLIGTSRLSAHLHFGEIGPRQIFATLRSHEARGQDPETYRRELGWREFSHHLLQAFPDTTTRPLDRRFERMRLRRRKATLHAWQRGTTGIPIVDAGMRELWRTGWMHNRVRMIVASFLTKNLQHHWLEGARWFWDTLVDADLANNTLGWQWTAGCGADAAPYYRIFNPVLQAERFDPQRTYIRQWIPELAKLPDRWIHRPWTASAKTLAEAGVRLGRTYPKPIVDLRRTRDQAMRAYDHIQKHRD